MNMRYEQIADSLSRSMADGTYKPGSKLPSIRDLAEQYECSRNTAIRAYEDLERRHLVYAVAKSGYYAVEKPESEQALELASQASMTDMASASPDERAMPYEDFRHCLNRAIDVYKDKLFAYGHPQGLPTLRELLVKRLYEDQIFTHVDQLFVVSGAQQAIHLLAGMPFPNGKSRILLEQPTYSGAIRSVQLQGGTAIGLERTADGIDLEELERQFRYNDIKFFYTIPRFHNPSGSSYSLDMKRSIVRLAEAYGVYILEDDYLGDLESGSRNDSMAAMDRSGFVIYLRSFSKTVLPGIRLGFASVPPVLVPALRLHKFAADSSTSAFTQGALEIFLKTGMFDRHLKKVRALYKERMSALRDACSRQLPSSIRYEVYEQGIFAAIELPAGLDAEVLAARLGRLGLSVVSGARLRLADSNGPQLLRLSIIRSDPEQINRGIRILAAEMKHAVKQLTDRRTSYDHAPWD
jgi:DNA-binding transcriptional MocR family regulator